MPTTPQTYLTQVIWDRFSPDDPDRQRHTFLEQISPAVLRWCEDNGYSLTDYLTNDQVARSCILEVLNQFTT